MSREVLSISKEDDAHSFSRQLVPMFSHLRSIKKKSLLDAQKLQHLDRDMRATKIFEMKASKTAFRHLEQLD